MICLTWSVPTNKVGKSSQQTTIPAKRGPPTCRSARSQTVKHIAYNRTMRAFYCLEINGLPLFASFELFENGILHGLIWNPSYKTGNRSRWDT